MEELKLNPALWSWPQKKDEGGASSFGKCQSKTHMLYRCCGSKACTTFRSRPAANVASLLSERGVTGVLKLKGELPPGPVE